MSAVAVAPVIRVEDLCIHLVSGEPVVEGVSFSVGAGEILGLVGESGSGKTTTALALLGYTRPGRRDQRGGTIEVGGESVLIGATTARCEACAARRCRTCRRIPAARSTRRCASATRSWTSCAPTARAPGRASRSRRRSSGSSWAPTRASPGAIRISSGGQQQRVTIAMACVCEPPVAVLDEPTTGLDVLTQDRILTELLRLRDEQGMAMVYVSHDLAVVAQMADRIVVMYAGRVVENGPAARSSSGRATRTPGRSWRPSPTSATRARCGGSPASRSASASGRWLRLRSSLPAPAGALP